jgi:hypothetical protein
MVVSRGSIDKATVESGRAKMMGKKEGKQQWCGEAGVLAGRKCYYGLVKVTLLNSLHVEKIYLSAKRR